MGNDEAELTGNLKQAAGVVKIVEKRTWVRLERVDGVGDTIYVQVFMNMSSKRLSGAF